MFQSYAHQSLSFEQLAHYAKQYQEIDMWQLLGQDENYFPFLTAVMRMSKIFVSFIGQSNTVLSSITMTTLCAIMPLPRG